MTRASKPVYARYVVVALAVLVFATAIAAVAPASARAGTYPLVSCYAYTSETLPRMPLGWSTNGYWAGQQTCPQPGLRFIGWNYTPFPAGSTGYWRYEAGSPLNITHFRFFIQGGDPLGDFEYSVATCLECPPSTVIGTRALSNAPWVWVEDEIPPTDNVYIRATCIAQAGCLGPPGVNMFNFEFTVTDNEAPVITFDAIYNYRFQRPVAGNWNKPSDVGFYATAIDFAHGVSRAAISTDGPDGPVSTWESGGGDYCTAWIYNTKVHPCGRDVTLAGPVDLSAVADGWHDFSFTARDIFGNAASSDSVRIAIDGTPPREPRHLAVSGVGAGGWTDQRKLTLTWSNTRETIESSTESGVAAAWYDVDPVSPGLSNPPAVRVSGTNIQSVSQVDLPEDGAWTIDVWTEDAVGNLSGHTSVDVGRDGDVPLQPLLQSHSWVSRQRLIAGYDQQWTQPATPELESGVCGYSFQVNGSSTSVPPPVANLLGPVTRAPVPASAGDGTNYVHVRAVSCAGRPSGTSRVPLRVDGSAPDVRLLGLPFVDWSATPLSLSVFAADSLSGVDHAFYGVDSGALTNITAMAPFPIGEGAHLIRYGAIDATGNESPLGTASVKVDLTAPSVSFEPGDAADPTRVTVQVGDGLSGVGSASLEYRRIDPGAAEDESWHALSPAVRADEASPNALTITRALPDDQLADGLYAVRAIAVDRAGNRNESGATKPDGNQKLISLPARDRLTLTAELAGYATRWADGKAKLWSDRATCAKRAKKCQRRSVVDFKRASGTRLVALGTKSLVVGSLRAASGEPVAHARLKIATIRRGNTGQVPSVEVTTGSDGGYSFAVPLGASRDFEVSFLGDALHRPAVNRATLLVKSGVDLRASSRRVRVGRRFELSGRLRSGGADLPNGGKLIGFEFNNGSQWLRTFRDIHTDTRGKFSYTHVFDRPTAKPYKVTLRAVVPMESSWPYLEGVSPELTLTVVP